MVKGISHQSCISTPDFEEIEHGCDFEYWAWEKCNHPTTCGYTC